MRPENRLCWGLSGPFFSVFRKDQTRISNYLKLWDQWIVLQDAEDKLENLADTVSVFPADGLSKLKDLEKNLENLGKSVIKEEKNQTDLLRQEQVLKINKLLLDQESEINELKENLTIYLSNVDEVSGNQQNLEQKKGEIRRSLEILGKDWTEEKVCGMDRSLFTQNSIRQHQSALQTGETHMRRKRAVTRRGFLRGAAAAIAMTIPRCAVGSVIPERSRTATATTTTATARLTRV